MEEFRDTLAARLDALARAHAVLSDCNWRSADLSVVVNEAAAVFWTPEDPRIRIEGPPVLVSARQALSLSLVLHELATNALKYGAGSTDDGQIRIVWWYEKPGDDGQVLRLRWEERGGPTPCSPEGEGGFGSLLMKTAIEYELSGTIETGFRSEGFTCEISIPFQEAA